MVGLSSVFAGSGVTGNVLTASLNPLGALADKLSGTPASAAPLEECGPLATDVAASTDTNADVGGTVNPQVNVSLPPIGPGIIPIDIPTVPPISFPPTDEPPTDDPPTNDPPTDEPPTDEPPTEEPPAAPSTGNLIGADVNLLGQDIVDIGILEGGLLGIGVDGLNPDGSGTGSVITVNDGNGDELISIGVDPQDDGIVDVNVNGEDVLDGLPLDGLDDLTGDDLIGGLVEDLLGGEDPLGGLLGGEDPLGGLLGDDLLGGLLN
jgi:hypothetical protein